MHAYFYSEASEDHATNSPTGDPAWLPLHSSSVGFNLAMPVLLSFFWSNLFLQARIAILRLRSRCTHSIAVPTDTIGCGELLIASLQ